MKFLILISATVLSVFQLRAQSDDLTHKPITIKVNGLSIFREGLEGSIEKEVTKKGAFEIAIGTSSWNNKTTEGVYDSISEENKYFQNTMETFTIYYVRAQWNYYVAKHHKAFSGLNLGPYVKLIGGTVDYSFISKTTLPYFGKENYVNVESGLFSFALGGNIGYQINLKNNITLGAFVQIGYKTGKVTPYFENVDYNNEYSKAFTPISVTGFDSNLGINLGIVL